jgi:Histidine kinase
MIAVLFIAIFLISCWQLVKVKLRSLHQHQQLILNSKLSTQKQLQNYALPIGNNTAMQEKSQDLVYIYNVLGHSIAALNIQLQVAQKLWQANPIQAQESLSEAYQLSRTLMQEVRQIVKILAQDEKT